MAEAERLELGPLDASEAHLLALHLLRLEPSASAELERRAGGHPATLVALVLSCVRRGLLELGVRGIGFRADAVIDEPNQDLSNRVASRWQNLAPELGVGVAAVLGPEVDRAIWEATVTELGLPVVVHVRDAGPVARGLLAGRVTRGQLQCYSEGPDELPAWRELGLVPSFAGPVTYRANGALRAAAGTGGPVLVETDAPYLAPDGHRGERNEPAFVAVTYRAIAAERGTDLASLIATTDETARSLFGPRW